MSDSQRRVGWLETHSCVLLTERLHTVSASIFGTLEVNQTIHYGDVSEQLALNGSKLGRHFDWRQLAPFEVSSARVGRESRKGLLAVRTGNLLGGCQWCPIWSKQHVH